MDHDSTMRCKADVILYVARYGNPTNLPLTNSTYPTIRDAIRFAHSYWKPVKLGTSPERTEDLAAAVENHLLVKAQHVVHHKHDAPDVVAYFRDERSRRNDRVTTARPGKYLAGNYSKVFSPTKIRDFADTIRVGTTDPAEYLKFAETREEIQAIYTAPGSMNEGSCMRHDNDQWNLVVNGEHWHPSAVYEGPDSRVAYLKIGNQLKARTVVLDQGRFTNNKRIIRIYGDQTLLEQALKDLGYSWGSFDGARLASIKLDCGAYMAPYFDGDCNTCNIGDDFLEMDYDGSHGDVDYQVCKLQNNTNSECQCCNDHYEANDMVRDFYDNLICESCAEYNYRNAYCDRNDYESLIHENDTVYCETNGMYYQDNHRCLAYNDVVCTDENEYRKKEECSRVIHAMGPAYTPDLIWVYDDHDVTLLCEQNGVGFYVNNRTDPQEVQRYYNEYFGNNDQVTITLEDDTAIEIQITEAA
jgi:hypothetical protein